MVTRWRIFSVFFSTDTKRLPRVGDIVTKSDQRLPWVVLRRQKIAETGQVLLSLQHGDFVRDNVKVELLEHWPQEGDRVAIALGAVIKWASTQGNQLVLNDANRMDSPFFKDYRVDADNGQFARIHNASGQGQWAGKKYRLPLEVLRVVEKADGRKAR
jgi:hypothetical protein